MKNNDENNPSLQEAHRIIAENIEKLPNEFLTLHDAKQRIASSDVVAAIPQPSFDEATRDGYVIALHAGSGVKTNQFKIIDEIPAGKPYLHALAPGTACRIMTGGCVPEGSSRVVCYEDCIEQNGIVIVAAAISSCWRYFYQKNGK